MHSLRGVTIAMVFDTETIPQASALASAVGEVEAICDLLDAGPDACDPAAVEAATEGVRAQTKTGWRYGRTKDPAKLYESLKADYDEMMGKLSKECALDPLRARVVAFSLAMVNYDAAGVPEIIDECVCSCDFEGGAENYDSDDIEARVIGSAFDILRHADGIATWNGNNFDCALLRVRAALSGVECPKSIIGARRHSYYPHADLMDFLAGQQRYFGLNAACGLWGIGRGKGGMDGGQVAQFIDEGRWEEVREYCRQDSTDRLLPLLVAFAPVIPGWNEWGKRARLALAEHLKLTPQTWRQWAEARDKAGQ